MGNATTHGMSRTKTYRAWCHMRERCDNPNTERYPQYGGRGISYDSRWNEFENFLADMGECPAAMFNKIQLDRKDNDGNYCKSNCQWTTDRMNVLNRGVQCNNSSGLRGVSWNERAGVWRAYFGKANTLLYRGSDFFEACCARKSWEAHSLLRSN